MNMMRNLIENNQNILLQKLQIDNIYICRVSKILCSKSMAVVNFPSPSPFLPGTNILHCSILVPGTNGEGEGGGIIKVVSYI